MINDWNAAIDFVLKMEGGYTLDPNDPGGETNYGISKKAYPSLDIKNLTVDQAKEIYLKDYWQVCECDELPTPFAISLFDAAVNQGVKRAVRLLQIALGATVDGVVGPGTIAAAFRANNSKVKLFLAKRLAEYTRTTVVNPSLEVFSVNWCYRVVSLAELVLKG